MGSDPILVVPCIVTMLQAITLAAGKFPHQRSASRTSRDACGYLDRPVRIDT